MEISFTVSHEQAKKLIEYHEELQNVALEEVKIACEKMDRKYELSAVKEMMGDALTDEERDMFDSIPF